MFIWNNEDNDQYHFYERHWSLFSKMSSFLLRRICEFEKWYRHICEKCKRTKNLNFAKPV